MKARTILGHIDCPHCGTAGGMRITPDRNGAPFGYCEAECGGQLRVGGDPRRVAAFYRKHPHVKVDAGQAAPAPAKPAAAPKAAPAAAAAKAPAPAPAAAPVPVPAPAAPRRLPGPFDFLSGGVR